MSRKAVIFEQFWVKNCHFCVPSVLAMYSAEAPDDYVKWEYKQAFGYLIPT